MNWKKKRFLPLVIVVVLLCGCQQNAMVSEQKGAETARESGTLYTFQNMPEYSGSPYVELNGNSPDFEEEEYTTEVFENYSDLDALGRCQTAYANICRE